MAMLTITEQHADGLTILDLGDTALVMSSTAGDWYVTTETSCTCPAFTHRPGPCKHMKAVTTLRRQQSGDALVERFEELAAANPGGDFIKLVKQAGHDVEQDRAAAIAEERMKMHTLTGLVKEAWL